jgi:hypothetical protein
MTTKRNVSVRLDPETYEALRQAAEEDHRSIEGHVRLLVHQHLKKRTTKPKDTKGDE